MTEQSLDLNKRFTHGSLFSGVGGFDLAAEWMGWENIFHCEINEFCQKVLKYYWPNAKSHTDITTTSFIQYRHLIGIVSGGFPCQPFSQAGKRKGKEDDRHLWPQMFRAVEEILPGWILPENVPGIINWAKGMVFDEVLHDLETAFEKSEASQHLKQCGYEVFPIVFPAAGIGAPHRRDRVWFIAYSKQNSNLIQIRRGNREEKGVPKINRQEHSKPGEFGGTNKNDAQRFFINQHSHTNSEGIRVERNGADREQKSQAQIGSGLLGRNYARIDWSEWPTEPAIRLRNDGFPFELDGITVSQWARSSIESFGNAIVPQVAYQIFKAIEQFEKI